jgi:quinol monooxygenase YgiN
MVLEVAHVDVLPGHQRAFEDALRIAVSTVLPQATGFIDFTPYGWGIERPSTFLFTIQWQTLADHLVGFRDSDLFTEWRELIGPHFAATPVVEHFQTL